MYYVYLIQSEKDGKLYIGQSSNLIDRLQRHNENRTVYTRYKGPWKLIGYKTYVNRSEAIKAECKLKTMKNKHYIIEYFSN
jgi:putative endonuclease